MKLDEPNIRGGKMVELEKEISCDPNIREVYETTDSVNIILIRSFKNMEELCKFTKHSLSIYSNSNTNTHLVLNKVKEDYGLLL